jgi:hypothetical protein
MATSPLQIHALFKLLTQPRFQSDRAGDHFDVAFTTDGVASAGRTIVDVGLHDCASVAFAVARGFVVHGFEPVPEHMTACHEKLRAGTYVNAPVMDLASGALALPAWRAQQRELLRGATLNATSGFAFLYQAAASNVSSVESSFTAGAGGSSGFSMPLEEAKARGRANSTCAGANTLCKNPRRISVPVLRLDDAIDEDLWALKMDTQGHEGHALLGASRLFARRAVAHTFLEFDPKLMRRGGMAPRTVLELLHAHGFVCFDVRNSQVAHWALTRDHPSDAAAYLAAMDANEAAHLRRRKPPMWAAAFGAFDDLACVNRAKPWQPAKHGAHEGHHRNGQHATPAPPVESAPLQVAPLQVHGLFKLLGYSDRGPLASLWTARPSPRPSAQGGSDSAMLRGVPPAGRTLVHAGLAHDACRAVAFAVSQGFVVHAFEGAPLPMAACREQLREGTYVNAPVIDLASGALALPAWRAQQRELLRGATPNATSGFAFLYQAAASNVSEATEPQASLRLSDAIDEDVWLLKVNRRGQEEPALIGASQLLARRAVAHAFVEFDPTRMRRGGIAPRTVLELLHAHGFVCFDTRRPPSALPKDHPLEADAYLEAMERRTPAGATGKAASDELVCVNVAKVWQREASGSGV